MEAALKTAMLATGKRGVIAFEGAYHGLGYGALNATHRAHFRGPFASQLLQLAERLGEKYQVDELAAKYEFTGRTPMSVPKALEVKQELEAIDKLLKQLEEALQTAQIGIIDLEELAKFAEPGDVEQLSALQQLASRRAAVGSEA